jgi:hypothetical protein
MADKPITHGFGVPNDPLPHQFLVRIPAGRTDPVEIWEDFGAAGVGGAGARGGRGPGARGGPGPRRRSSAGSRSRATPGGRWPRG